MRKILIISYNPSSTNDKLCSALESQGPWWHYLQYTWLISTTDSPAELYNKLAPILTKTDRIFIGVITSEYEGWLDKAAWDWIKNVQ